MVMSLQSMYKIGKKAATLQFSMEMVPVKEKQEVFGGQKLSQKHTIK